VSEKGRAVFSWDDAKNESNKTKHGISFDLAKLVFEDPLHITRQDRAESGELRWQTVGLVGNMMLLLVAHTWHETSTGEEYIRIISARRATRIERKIYEENI